MIYNTANIYVLDSSLPHSFNTWYLPYTTVNKLHPLVTHFCLCSCCCLKEEFTSDSVFKICVDDLLKNNFLRIENSSYDSNLLL